jgi:hypothetical protein
MVSLVRLLPVTAAAGVMALTLATPATGIAAAPAGHARHPAVARAMDRDFLARLHGSSAFPNTHGHSEYDRTATHREVEVAVNNAPSRIRGHLVTVYVNRKKVGTMRVNRFGHAFRDWETSRGQFVPWAGAGSPCRVRTAKGKLVVSGTYVRESDS